MEDIKTIILPVDFSETSVFIAEWAKKLAKKLGAKIILINVIEDIPAFEEFSTNAKTLEELEKTFLS